MRRGGSSNVADELRYVVVGIVGKHLLEVVEAPRHKLCGCTCALRAEQYLQDRDEGGKREDVEYSRQDVEHNRQGKVLLVWRYEAPQYLEKFFHLY